MGLRAAVYVAPPIPFRGRNPATDLWSPIPCTLIYGDVEAVLVDTPITIAQTKDLADWIEATIPGKHLGVVYITHGHGDHWTGLPTLRKRFPGLKAVATKGTIEHMKKDAGTDFSKSVWEKMFPKQIDHQLVMAEPLPADGFFTLEGHVIQAVEVGHSDTYDSTVLWVPDLKLAVCGDVVYGDVHQMLAEAKTPELQLEWIRAIEKVEALKPEHVVPGHMKAGELTGVFHLAASKKYIRDFMRLKDASQDADELISRMVEIYPTRYNLNALSWGAKQAFPKKGRL
jgi:glyoxylase-like metal-dependent hydrolase (beta-lactamase superfamily II)